MSLFIDKYNRRKSPFILAVFGAALLEFCLFGLMYALLAEPLYYAVAFASPLATAAAHSLIIAAAGTAASCLGFLLPDKRLVPWGFAGLGVILCMFCAAALLLEPWARGAMLALILAYGLPPVLVGNAVTWLIYRVIRRTHPELTHRERKTIQEELREAAAREEAARGEKSGPAEPPPAPPEAPEGAEDFAGGPPPFRSAQDEAMLLYGDDDEESDD